MSGENSAFEERVRLIAKAFPFHRRAFLDWRDRHRLRLKALFARLDDELAPADAERVKALLREEL